MPPIVKYPVTDKVLECIEGKLEEEPLFDVDKLFELWDDWEWKESPSSYEEQRRRKEEWESKAKEIVGEVWEKSGTAQKNA